jgi:hypothetical protein
MAIFVSYCPQFWGSGVIYKVHDTQYMFERFDQKLVVFAFMDVSMSYCLQFCGSVEIYKEYDSLYILERNDKKSLFLRLCLFS